jgi:Fe-S cluster biogenesis protein NfuA
VREDAERLITEVIEPLLGADGGGIELVAWSRDADDGITITLRLKGACAGCPGLPYTRSRVIEPVLKRAIAEDIVLVFVR